ncbi:MAG: helix-turn-helix domain-containing protein [Clostridia bacterium]|nr:helix-turn-helix domain-containing protein [Clostridia bacterium]
MEFSEKLKKYRNDKNVSQQQLADAIFVSRSAVAKWENGLGLPCKESLNLLCEYFEVEESELLRENENESVQKNRKIFKFKKLLIVACAVIGVFVALTITGLALYFSGALDSRPQFHPFPEDYPIIEVDGVKASEYTVLTPIQTTSDEVLTGVNAFPYGDDAKKLPLLPFKTVYPITLPDDAAMLSVEYMFLNDDYSLIEIHDLSAIGAPRFPIEPATLWFRTETYNTATLRSEKGDVKMNFVDRDYNVIILQFKYSYHWYTAVSYFRVER